MPRDSVDGITDQETLDELVERLDRERIDADRAYNDALTALDRALSMPPPEWPDAPAAPDLSRLGDLNREWDTRTDPPPAADRSLRGRLRSFIWRVIGPPLEAQRAFNSTVVDQFNRLAPAAEAAPAAVAHILDALRTAEDARRRFSTHLILYLQTITAYIDTRDRTVGGQARVLNDVLSAVTDEWLKRWSSLQARDARIAQQVRDMTSALDDVRATSGLAHQTAVALRSEVAALAREGGGSDRPPAVSSAPPGGSPAASAPVAPGLDESTYLTFENQFRGSTDDIRARLEAYLPRFRGRSDVLEIGCGRGEFLELLRDHGVTARGLDINAAMVRATTDRGLDAVRADGLAYVSGLPDASLGGLFAAQVVEHLTPAYLAQLVAEAFRVLRPGGIIVLETINPSCWNAFFESYIRDVTHVKPLHPETLQFLVRASGFQRVELEFKSPVPAAARLTPLPTGVGGDDEAYADLVEHLNANIEKLNDRLFGNQDYAVVGEK